jgi:glucose/arabinose dehydrogenase
VTLVQPWGIAVEDSDDILVTDVAQGAILRVPAAGGSSTVVASGLGLVWGIAVDPSGDIYVVDSSTFQLRKVLGGSTTLVADLSSLTSPRGLAIEPSGDFLVTDLAGDTIWRVSADGSSVTLLSTGGLLSQPYFVTIVPPGPPPPAVPLGSPGVWLLLVLVLATTGAHRLRGARRATG